MKKSIKSLTALFLVFMLSFGIFMSVNVKADSYITVKIQMTGMRGANSTSTEVIAEGNVPFTSGMTAFDAIKAIAISSTDTDSTEVIDGVTYHNMGLLRWSNTQYGNYISAIKVEGHSQNNRYFSNNGAASYYSISNNRGQYFRKTNVTSIETNFHYPNNGTWSNMVHKENYVSEKDYNKFSGWMLLINGSTNNDGVDTVLTTNPGTITLDFSMMMGLDLGQGSYMQDYESGQWGYVQGWN